MMNHNFDSVQDTRSNVTPLVTVVQGSSVSAQGGLVCMCDRGRATVRDGSRIYFGKLVVSATAFSEVDS